ncbi:MAG: tetratricopeptide repeat protein [Deltaproteobacteria bacterium]|nr:tetratricopeptide repeat protein [Deltaproteobacteria bacterium]
MGVDSPTVEKRPLILGPRNEEELRALIRALAGAKGFTLLLIRCDDLRLREEITARLRRRKHHGMAHLPEMVELPYPGRHVRLHEFLASSAKDLPSYSALFLCGMEEAIRTDDGGLAILHELNLARELIKSSVPHVLAIWLPADVMGLLVTEAPDLWAWRAAELEFAPFSPHAVAETRQEHRQTWELPYDQLHTEVVRLQDLVQKLERSQDRGDISRLAGALERLGDSYARLYELTEATQALGRALTLYREIGDRLGEANCIKSLGDIALERSDHAEARRRYEEALPIYEEFGDPYSMAVCLLAVAKLEQAMGHLDEATIRLEAAQKLAEELDHAGLLEAIEDLRARLAS